MKTVSIYSLLLFLVLVLGAAQASEFVVNVTPSSNLLKRNIEGYLSTLQADDAQELRRIRHVAMNETAKAAQALGFYRTRITSHVQDGEKPKLIIDVETGPRVKLRNVDIKIEGAIAEVSGFQRPDITKLKPGSSLNQGLYEDAKRLIQNQASRYGFFDGRFVRHKLLIDPEDDFADIDLVYRSGQRYRLGKVSFSGDNPFNEALLQEMVPFKPGADYNADLIAELYQALQSTGYFESVRVDAMPSTARDYEIPVDVVLTARVPNSLSFGAGFSTDVGARLRTSWTRHWSNAAGHSYGSEVELSQIKQNVGLWYDIPGDPPTTDKLRIAGGYQYEAPRSNDTMSRMLKVGPEWYSLLSNGWQRVLSVKYLHENYRLGDENGRVEWLMPGASFSFARSDDPLNPNYGYRIQMDMSAAVKGLMADQNVLHGMVLLKGLTTIFEYHRFLGRIQVGGTETNGFGNVPPSLRFFAGGDQSVRGYEYQSLSPRNRQGDKIGGRYLFAASTEYQYSLTDTWRLAAFIDKGNAYNSLTEPGLKTGVGVGVRWISPVGPIRVDLAHPVGDSGVRLHFSMGPEL